MKTTIRILSALIAGLVGMFVGECALAYTLLRVVPPNLTDVQIEVQREFTILRYAQAWSWRAHAAGFLLFAGIAYWVVGRITRNRRVPVETLIRVIAAIACGAWGYQTAHWLFGFCAGI